MTLKEIVDLITDNGVCIALLIYYMFRDYKLVSDLKDTMAVVKSYIRKQEKRLDSEEDCNK